MSNFQDRLINFNQQLKRDNLLNTIANCLQVYNTILLEKDASNNDVMQALQQQNTEYFERMIKQLDEIKNLLTELKKDIIK